MYFSNRMLLEPMKIIQLNNIDDDLKNLLWNVVIKYINNMTSRKSDQSYYLFKSLAQKYWHEIFKLPIDTIPVQEHEIKYTLKNMYMQLVWYKIYNFLELSSIFFGKQFALDCNKELELENSGYRFVNEFIVPITNQLEIESIEKSISEDIDKQITEHMKNSLRLLSDKTQPDYKNSMKESISAVETYARVISNQPSKILPDILKKDLEFHPALSKTINSIYGYTSDEGGVRHGNKLIPSIIDKSHALFLLVACSAIINLIKQHPPQSRKIL